MAVFSFSLSKRRGVGGEGCGEVYGAALLLLFVGTLWRCRGVSVWQGLLTGGVKAFIALSSLLF